MAASALEDISKHDAIDLYNRLVRNGVGVLSLQDAVDLFANADPSPDHRFVRWLVEAYKDKRLAPKDLRRAHDVLVLFMSVEARLAADRRDLDAYRDLEDLCDEIEQFASTTPDFSLDRIKQEQRDRAHLHSIVICDRDDLTLAVPLTKDALAWWAAGRRMAPSETDGDAQDGIYPDPIFDRYILGAPLVVIDLHDGSGNLWLFLTEDGAVITDASARHVDPAFVDAHWDKLEGVMAWASDAIGGGDVLCYLPDRILTEEFCSSVVWRDGGLLGKIPLDKRTVAVCDAAFDSDGLAFDHVPEVVRTAEWIRGAIAKRGFVIERLPEWDRTPEFCEIAVNAWPGAIRGVPHDIKTHALCRKAVESQSVVLQHVPWKFRDPELCAAAVKANPMSLEWVPTERKTLELCVEAVRARNEALRFVPPAMRSEVMDILPGVRPIPSGPRKPQLPGSKVVINAPDVDPSGKVKAPHNSRRWRTDHEYIERLKAMADLKLATVF